MYRAPGGPEVAPGQPGIKRRRRALDQFRDCQLVATLGQIAADDRLLGIEFESSSRFPFGTPQGFAVRPSFHEGLPGPQGNKFPFDLSR